MWDYLFIFIELQFTIFTARWFALGREQLPGEPRFWQGICEEALANYLWQNADFPPGGVLRVEDLTTGLRRFVDAVLAA